MRRLSIATCATAPKPPHSPPIRRHDGPSPGRGMPAWMRLRMADPAFGRTAREDRRGPRLAGLSGGSADRHRALPHGLTKPRRGANGKRIRPCKPSTLRTRRAELIAAARMAVRQGVPIASLTSLGVLVDPAVVEQVIEAYWKQDGAEPRRYTIDLGWKLLAVARETGCLDDIGLKRLDDLRATLEDYRQQGLTEKNLKVIRRS